MTGGAPTGSGGQRGHREDDGSFGASVGGLRVALVHDWLTGMRGGEKVLEAIGDLFPDAPIYTLIAFEDALSEGLRRHPIHTSFLQGWPFVRSKYRHYLPFFPAAVEDFDLSGYDLVISTSHCVAKGIVPGPRTLHLSYCHSPMRYAWDQEHQYFPARRGPVARLRSLALSALRAWDVASTPRVDHFWANSRFVARRIGRYYDRDAEVLPPPVAVEDFAPADDRTRADETSGDDGPDDAPFALAVSALVPYKRIDLAIRACEHLGMELRVVGTGPEKGRLQRLCRRHARLLGRVSDAELRRLYRQAALFLQPGVEDFGMASVEALASGTPVVAVAEGGVLDIVEDGVHGVLYHGFEVSDVAAAIDKCREIRFNHLKLGSRADSFSSQRFADRIRASITHHLARARSGRPRRRPEALSPARERRDDDPQATTE